MKQNLIFLIILVLTSLNNVYSLSRNLGKSEKAETSLGLFVQKTYNEFTAVNSLNESKSLDLDENAMHPGFNEYSRFIIHGY